MSDREVDALQLELARMEVEVTQLRMAIKVLKGEIEQLNDQLRTAEWYKLPLDLRQRYWRETNYGVVRPSRELMADIKAVLARTAL